MIRVWLRKDRHHTSKTHEPRAVPAGACDPARPRLPSACRGANRGYPQTGITDGMNNKRPASLRRRFAAMLYDSLLIIALLFLATLPFTALRGGEAVEGSTAYELSLMLVVYLFFLGFWSTRGRTLGMQSWGLQLEDANGRVPSPRQASIRFVVSLVSLAAFGLGFFWQLVDKDRMTWHDRASRTRVMHYPPLKKSKPGKPAKR